MVIETIFLFTTFCGFAGVFLKRNLLNTIVSLSQVAVGITALTSINIQSANNLALYIILFLVLSMTIFIYTIAVLLIRRRSTLQVNELTELRG